MNIRTAGRARRHAHLETPTGPMVVLAGERGLTGLYFHDHRTLPDRSLWGDPDPVGLAGALAALGEYFKGERQTFTLPLELEGTAFQREVWHALMAIPYGQTTSYGALATRLGRPSASRAVGAAVGANPLSIVVPCHRVLSTDGRLTGYAGGLERKRWLLQLEAEGRRGTSPPGRRETDQDY